MIAGADVVDVAGPTSYEELVARVSDLLATRLPATRDELARAFLDGTRFGATPVAEGVALPHLRLEGIDRPEMVMARAAAGVTVEVAAVHGPAHRETLRAIFFLVSPERDPKMHLRLLAQIAERVDDPAFMPAFLGAADHQVLREILLRDERFLSLRVGGAAAGLAGRALRDLDLPEGVLVALIHRHGRILVPRGRTELEPGDRLTVLGAPADIAALRERYR